MYHKAADVRTLLLFPLMALGSALLFTQVFDWFDNVSLPTTKVTFDLTPDGSSLVLITRSASKPELSVSAVAGERSIPVMGRVEVLAGMIKFIPVAPLIRGQHYRAEWLAENGSSQKLEFEFHNTAQETPTVRFAPQAKLPANALKFYLHFSEPMEQGIFLERLRLLNADGKEVIGPFRETELWSPDGKRLTVWFHPGRQKTGVNLNEDEGPVLSENTKHTLVVDGRWRSTQGQAIGSDVRFDFQVGAADHTMPNMELWHINKPKPGTRDLLIVQFDEPLDSAMLLTALQVWHEDAVCPLKVTISEGGRVWQGQPQHDWAVSVYELRANPLVEDLAGNNFQHPFEVDVQQTAGSGQKVLKREVNLR